MLLSKEVQLLCRSDLCSFLLLELPCGCCHRESVGLPGCPGAATVIVPVSEDAVSMAWAWTKSVQSQLMVPLSAVVSFLQQGRGRLFLIMTAPAGALPCLTDGCKAGHGLPLTCTRVGAKGSLFSLAFRLPNRSCSAQSATFCHSQCSL